MSATSRSASVTPCTAKRRAQAKPQRHDVNIVMLGCDGAGRKTILSNWRGSGKVEGPPPHNHGFHAQRLRGGGGAVFFPTGMSNPKELRANIRSLCGKVSHVVFVVDSAGGSEVLGSSSRILQGVLQEPHLRDAKVVLVANKQDFAGAIPGAELVRMMGLRGVAQKIEVIEASGQTGFGLNRLFKTIAPKAYEAAKASSRPRRRHSVASRSALETPAADTGRGRETSRSPKTPSKEHREKSRQRGRSSDARPGSATAAASSPNSKWKRATCLVGAVRQLAGEAYEKGPERFAGEKLKDLREFADDAAFAAEMGCRETAFHMECRMYDAVYDGMHEMNARLNALTA